MSFQSPNYTQVPNDFFEMVKDMTEAELRVTSTMIRQTFGFHRQEFKMGIKELAENSGLSEQGARDGAEAAEKRGTFKRLNPDTKQTSEWMLNVVDLQPVEVEPPASRGQTSTELTTGTVLKKEKKVKKKKDYLDLLSDMKNNPASKQAQEIAEMYDKLDSEFKSTFPRNGSTDVVVKFVIAREKLGEPLEKFGQWARRDEFNAARLYEYAESPIKIKTRWQHAFDDNPDNKYTGGNHYDYLEGL